MEEQANKGCIIVQRDRFSTYDVNTKRFSAEKDAEVRNRLPPSRNPRYEEKNHSLATWEVRGIPVLTFIQDISASNGATRTRFLYVADGVNVWTVVLISGKQEDLSAAIWSAFIGGL
jgi:hypothetical protein